MCLGACVVCRISWHAWMGSGTVGKAGAGVPRLAEFVWVHGQRGWADYFDWVHWGIYSSPWQRKSIRCVAIGDQGRFCQQPDGGSFVAPQNFGSRRSLWHEIVFVILRRPMLVIRLFNSQNWYEVRLSWNITYKNPTHTYLVSLSRSRCSSKRSWRACTNTTMAIFHHMCGQHSKIRHSNTLWVRPKLVEMQAVRQGVRFTVTSSTTWLGFFDDDVELEDTNKYIVARTCRMIND